MPANPQIIGTIVNRALKSAQQTLARRFNLIVKIQYFSLIAVFLVFCVAAAGNPRLTEEQPAAENPEPELEPTPIPGTELLLTPQTTSPQAPLPGRTLELGPPVVVEPILPPVNLEALAQSGRLWSFRGVVREFRFAGNHVFSAGTLEKVIEKYRNRELTAEDLEQARRDLTLFYINHGYVSSGAILPDQEGKDGIITFQLVEGRLAAINVKGNFWFRPWWLRNEIRRGTGRALNFDKLKETLQLLRQNPTISRINAELKPGGVPGENILDVDIKDTQPFRFALEFNNKRPPSVGAELVQARLTDLNLTGHNDPVEIVYGIAHTRDGEPYFSGIDNIDGSYTFPVTPWGTTLQVHATKSDTSIIEEPVADLDIESKLEQYGATLRQPIHQSLNSEFAISLTADKRRSKTFLFGEPFSLSPGAVNGETSVSVLRLAQEFVNRSQAHVLAARSTFSLGIDALDATNSGAAPNSRFFYWLGQSQYVRRIGKSENFIFARLNAQFSSRPLFSLEQFSIGGVESVRGYRENTVLRDNGVFGSVEVRVPVWSAKEHTPILMLAPFFDIGTGWDDSSKRKSIGTGTSSKENDSMLETLPSLGLGLIFQPTKHAHAELYWGYGLNRDFIADGNNLQDYGIHFSITVNAF